MASTKLVMATTTAVTDKCIFTWTIENYGAIKTKVGEDIESPEFSMGSDDEEYFKLRLYPEGDKKETEGFVSLYLRYLKTKSTKNPKKLLCRNTISAIRDEKVVRTLSFHEDFLDSIEWGWDKYFEKEKIDQLISSNNTVTIQCVLEVLKELKSSLDSIISNNEDETIHGVKFNLPFLNEDFSDVKLTASDEKVIPAHKFVLATCSPVFKAMFTHDVLESKKNTVEITDTPHNVLIEMLRFMYTGDIVSTATDMTIKILAVADKYQIDNLKIKCGNILGDELTTVNAIEILIAAHKYDVKHLKSIVLKFVTTHIQSFVDTEELKKITEPDILFNVIQSMTNSSK